MKVGIVTQPLYANYGGILQNYALQQVLKKMGHEPITIDYMPSLSLGRYVLYVGKSVFCSLSPKRRHPIKPYNHYLQRPDNIESFVSNNIILTKTVPDYTKVLLKKNGIEALIVGSDQVWRYSYNSSHIEDMYLAFAKDYPCKRIAYGASFGVDRLNYPEAQLKEVRELINRFDAVSVREDTGVSICNNEMGINPVVVLDPTLCLGAFYYDRFSSKCKTEEVPYLAAYVLDKTEEKDMFISSVAKARGLIVKEMTVSNASVSIEEWLSVIKNANYVITDSYHGSLFSIIFEKEFRTFVNNKRGANRFHTLFKKLNLQECLLEEGHINFDGNSWIDYESVRVRLEELRKESLSFLNNALK